MDPVYVYVAIVVDCHLEACVWNKELDVSEIGTLGWYCTLGRLAIDQISVDNYSEQSIVRMRTCGCFSIPGFLGTVLFAPLHTGFAVSPTYTTSPERCIWLLTR